MTEPPIIAVVFLESFFSRCCIRGRGNNNSVFYEFILWPVCRNCYLVCISNLESFDHTDKFIHISTKFLWVIEHSTQDRAADRVGEDVAVLIESVEDGRVTGRAEHQGPEDSDTSWELRGGESSGDAPHVGQIVQARVVEALGVDLVAEPVGSG